MKKFDTQVSHSAGQCAARTIPDRSMHLGECGSTLAGGYEDQVSCNYIGGYLLSRVS
jgi:hypothetical protein